MKKQNKTKFSWESDVERARRHMQISPKNKLIWLKEINDLVWSSLSLKQKQLYWKKRLGASN